MAGMAGYGLKWLERDGYGWNDWKLLELDVNGMNWLEWLKQL